MIIGINSSDKGFDINNNFSSDSEEENHTSNREEGSMAKKNSKKKKSAESETDTDSELEEIKKTVEEDKIYDSDFLTSLFKLQKYMDNQNKLIKSAKLKLQSTGNKQSTVSSSVSN